MAEEKKEVALKESNTPALLGFIFSLTICLYFPGLILSIIGLATAKNYKNSRKGLAIAGVIISGIFFLIGIIALFSGEAFSTSNNIKSTPSINTVTKKKKIEVIDFSSMTKADIDSWCENNKITCTYSTEYSDSVPKDGFISQSVSEGKKVFEGDYITIKFSLGKEPSTSQKNALNKALSYLRYSSFSYTGLIEQLEYEKFSHEDAVYGVDNCGADWNEQAKKKAAEYLKYDSFSRDGLIDQLEYEGFTYDQAVYGVTQNGL